jgi:hypothetical protein
LLGLGVGVELGHEGVGIGVGEDGASEGGLSRHALGRPGLHPIGQSVTELRPKACLAGVQPTVEGRKRIRPAWGGRGPFS